MVRLEGSRSAAGAMSAARAHGAGTSGATALARWLCAVVAAGVAAAQAQPAAQDAAAAFRYHAPITIEQPGAFVRLALPASAYAMSRQVGLADLRVLDARGERVPFALLGPREREAHETVQARPAGLYPLPPRQRADQDLASPLEVQVVGERITVRRLAPPAERRPARLAGASAATPATDAPRPTPGWLFDLGEPSKGEPAASALRLAWVEPAEFTAAYELDLSDDLKQWRRAGGGHLLALKSAGGLLAQREVPLPASPAQAAQLSSMPPRSAAPMAAARFVRLRWADPAGAPVLTAAEQLRVQRSAIDLDAPTAIVVPVGPEPKGSKAPIQTAPAATTAPGGGAAGEGALHYDLGAVLPLVELDLPLPAGVRVAPVRVQGRVRASEPWRELAQTVFYRIERGAVVDRPPPLVLAAGVRYLRLVPDARAGALPAVPLAVRAQLQSVVFAPQGQAPFRLLAGSAEAPAGALPLATLVPALDSERARFGRAVLGGWSEDEAAARAEAWQARLAAWRPALLWAVLLAGVGGLGFAVWRLARKEIGAAASPPAASGAGGTSAG
ncbi:MAG: DUF3999 family protein [Rubrivivax sp.]|nr:DUF3999 family protein [Rubrivivax sp.]